MATVADPAVGPTFRWTPNGPSPDGTQTKEADIQFFEKLGNLVGLAIYSATFIDLPLPQFFYKMKRLGAESVTLEDYAEWQPEEARSLRYILDYDKHEECALEDLLCRTFSRDVTFEGQKKTIELKPGGADIYVTKDNREEFVRLYIEFEVQTQAKTAVEQFWKGVERFVHPQVLDALFDYDELAPMICGQQRLNFQELKDSTAYGGGFSPDHPTIKWFWEVVLEEWDAEQRHKLLAFSTGSDRAPVNGLKALRFQVVQDPGKDDQRLPNSHTCFNSLHMPAYSSMEVLRRNLELAVLEHTRGFGFI